MKSTRQVLLTSGFSLLLCLTMLISSTVAWFSRNVGTTARVNSGTFATTVTAQGLTTGSTRATGSAYTVTGINGGQPFSFEEQTTELLNAEEIPLDSQQGKTTPLSTMSSELLNVTDLEPAKADARLITIKNTGTLSQTFFLTLTRDEFQTTAWGYEERETAALESDGITHKKAWFKTQTYTLTDLTDTSIHCSQTSGTVDTLDTVISADFLFVPSEQDLSSAKQAIANNTDETAVSLLSASTRLTYDALKRMDDSTRNSITTVNNFLTQTLNPCKLNELNEKKLMVKASTDPATYTPREITLKSGEAVQFLLWYEMDATATTDYMGLTYAGNLTVQVKQASVEVDSFGSSAYDADATTH